MPWGIYQNDRFSLLLLEPWGWFHWSLLCAPVTAPAGKSTGLPPLMTCYFGVFLSQACRHGASSNSLQFRFSQPGTRSPGDSCLVVSTQVSCDSLYLPACLSLQFEGYQFALWPYFSDRSKKRCWFFSPKFAHCSIGMETSKLLTCQIRIRQSFKFILSKKRRWKESNANKMWQKNP